MHLVNNADKTSVTLPAVPVATYGLNKRKKVDEVRVKAILTPDRYVFRKQSFAHGGSARVFVGMDPASTTFYAIKEIALRHKRTPVPASVAKLLQHCVIRELSIDDVANTRFGIVRAVANAKLSRIYIVQNLLSGRVLDAIGLMSRVAPRVDLAVYFAQETVRDLQRLQAKNILHFDLTVFNICYHTPSRQVQIIDFGLSVVGDRAIPAGSTEQYASPRHIAGTMSDRRDDLFSLGVSFCEFLLGESYLGRKTVQLGSASEGLPAACLTDHLTLASEDLDKLRQGQLESDRAQKLETYHRRLLAASQPFALLCLDMTDLKNRKDLKLDEVAQRLAAMQPGAQGLDRIDAAWATLPEYSPAISRQMELLEADVAKIRTRVLSQLS